MNYEQAQEIQYSQLAVFDIIITKIKGFKTPIKISRRTESTVWYKLLDFKGLNYEGDDQVATYSRFPLDDTEEVRLSKNYKFVPLGARGSHTEPAKFYKVQRVGDHDEFKHIGNSVSYQWIEEEEEEEEDEPFVAQQPPNA